MLVFKRGLKSAIGEIATTWFSLFNKSDLNLDPFHCSVETILETKCPPAEWPVNEIIPS